MGHKPLDLSVIIVNYNTGKLLYDCLRSIFNETINIEFEVSVVDNASTDGSIRMVERCFPRVQIIKNSENMGFARANNQAIVKSKGRYLLLLNPDTIVLSDAITKFVEFMDTHPDAGLAGCKLLAPDGTIQYSMRNFPTITNQLFECLFLHRLFPKLTPLLGEVIYQKEAYCQENKVGWVSGAAMIVRREVLRKAGLLDENFFLYAEEIDWCYRISQVGYNIYFYPGAQIIHYAGEFKSNPNLLIEDLRSRLQLYQKHYSSLRVLGFRLVMFLYLLIRVCTYFVAMAIFRNKRASIRLNAYWQGLRQFYAKGMQI